MSYNMIEYVSVVTQKYQCASTNNSWCSKLS